jgi:hypothetical protein
MLSEVIEETLKGAEKEVDKGHNYIEEKDHSFESILDVPSFAFKPPLLILCIFLINLKDDRFRACDVPLQFSCKYGYDIFDFDSRKMMF